MLHPLSVFYSTPSVYLYWLKGTEAPLTFPADLTAYKAHNVFYIAHTVFYIDYLDMGGGSSCTT
jgi:hypothetical protein